MLGETKDVYIWLERARSETLLKGGQRRYDLLEYLVREELEQRGENLKAYAIALDVLGRSEDFDPATDSIVRVEVARLRDALELHYARSTDLSEPRVSIPKGSYRPVIEWKAGSIELKAERKRYSAFWPAISVAFTVFVCFLGWFLFQSRATDQSAEGIHILIAPPQVEHLSEETADFLVGLSSGLRQSLSKKLPLTIMVGSEADKHAHHQYELILRAIGLPKPDRISIELMESMTSVIAWADAYRLEPEFTAEKLDSLVSRVSDDLFPQIVTRSKNALEAQPLGTLNPWELYLLSTWMPGSELKMLDWEIQRRDIALRAVSLDPELGQAHSVLADKLAYLSSVDGNHHSTEAVENARFHARQALLFASRDTNALFNIGIHHWHLGEIGSAIQMLERVISIDPSDGFAGFLKMVWPYTCTAAPDDIVEAARAFDRQLKSDNPIRWVTLTSIGNLHLNREEFDAALKVEQEAHAILHSPDSVMRHAVILNTLGREQEAKKLIKEEISYWPNLDPAHFAAVTMPRRCKYASEPSKILSHYANFASAQ